MTAPVILDWDRVNRVGITEAVLCEPKTTDQLVAVLDQANSAGRSMLLTRLTVPQLATLPAQYRARIDYEEVSRTAFFGSPTPVRGPARVAVVTGGTSDIGVAREAVRTLRFHGHAAVEIYDAGVAGLWRIQQHLAEIAGHQVIIACAGMDAALPTVLAGLVPGLVIAVPTSVGYGVAQGGRSALHSLLSSCAPGLVVTNIDNGYGAACAAMRSLPHG
jgi:pyridinium-3,5-biscarboxylic acid mononucleotide synthase